ncbi:hypothetical protein [Yinghuangia seranimata]|uniref:hypothetical protein n=1 Tax=Yinghuangia seranimata TaxID=408067 RepID=UPI00248B073D|nr:hypothetical protein [Yinghuangia seranimata]MDI2131416.1 hypothetical protein [Yinghuangia seranimata]
MTWEHLVCANCAGPVSEGRCSVCRASRERMNRESGLQLSPGLLAALAALVVVAAVLLQKLAG